jgi:hypothetical protein
MRKPLASAAQDDFTPTDIDRHARDTRAAAGEAVAAEDQRGDGDAVQGMIPGRSGRQTKVERVSMRILATGGIIGLATVLGAVLVANDVAGWVVGLVVGLTSVVLAAVLWSSRQL